MDGKPLKIKAYGSIGHLPNSRLGPGDHSINPGQARICLERTRDKHDHIVVQQKYDGSCVAVLRRDGDIIPLVRAGYLATSSPYEQHQLFHYWAMANKLRFLAVLKDEERICGEWLAQAHGTRYDINCLFEPFIAFDIMRGHDRMPFEQFIERIVIGVDYRPDQVKPLCTPQVVGYGPMPVEAAMEKVCNPWAKDPIEGVVYRVERKGKVDFLAKYVRPDKVDGCYLVEEVDGVKKQKEPIWNWHPSMEVKA